MIAYADATLLQLTRRRVNTDFEVGDVQLTHARSDAPCLRCREAAPVGAHVELRATPWLGSFLKVTLTALQRSGMRAS
jgi:hypothetical protein